MGNAFSLASKDFNQEDICQYLVHDINVHSPNPPKQFRRSREAHEMMARLDKKAKKTSMLANVIYTPCRSEMRTCLVKVCLIRLAEVVRLLRHSELEIRASILGA